LAEAHLGYDFMVEQGRYGIGPALGLVHVFQPNGELRPDDANILSLGVHVMFDSADPVARRDEDRDKDGILDPVDKCPDDPEDKDGFEDVDGCPELDNDEDGIVDAADHCPLVPEDKDGFEDEDGCPEPDNDKDGILDADDLCPNEPETVNGYADHDGCPDEDQIRVVGDKIVLDDHVHFRTNNATIRPQSYPLLKRLAKLLGEHPEYVHIEVHGHTDDRGADSFNQKLSEDRASSVVEFLVKHGIERDRLSSKGFGDTVPITDEKTEYALFLNRRVELAITRVSPDDAEKLKAQGKSVSDIEVRDPSEGPPPVKDPPAKGEPQ
jgi:outer membrane protein OmpA-like peptidoglycan-associated protein